MLQENPVPRIGIGEIDLMTLIQADAIHLPYRSNYFHAIVTSPPYWGLRKYAGEQGEEPLGLEATPERHIERMVECFREVRRVLRDDGVVWLNYGDCYSSGSRGYSAGTIDDETGWKHGPLSKGYQGRAPGGGVEGGNLMLMPHRLAIALQDDGWIVRNDLVWFKRNPMPESVAGWRFENGKLRKSSWRHTRAHEYVFQLVKKMGYYCNQEAVREEQAEASKERYEYSFGGNKNETLKATDKPTAVVGDRDIRSGRNPRSVLDVPTAPYKGAHYATFPPKLIAPLIRASVPRRCCPECGMAWAAVVEKSGGLGKSWHDHGSDETQGAYQRDREYFDGKAQGTVMVDAWKNTRITVTDYRPTCECGIEEHEPGIVLDIFGGSGTTGMVAKQLLRRWVVMDISRPYLDEQSKIRTKTGTPSNTFDGLPLFEELE